MAIAQSVLDTIVARTGESKVANVRLQVGKLSGVLADALRFSFEIVASGSGLEDAGLEIDEPDGRAKCAECGVEFAVPDLILLCPCGSADVDVLAGDELQILSVEVVV